MSFVLTDHLGSAVVHLRLNRPDARNALSAEMCNDIVEALEEIDRNNDARVVVLSGEGTVFCAGADIGASVRIGSWRSAARRGRSSSSSGPAREGAGSSISVSSFRLSFR